MKDGNTHRVGTQAHADWVDVSNQSNLLPHHIEHLQSEGFAPTQILLMEEMGVRSLSESEAKKKGFVLNKQSSSGIFFPFTLSFGQIRFDTPPLDEREKPCKYMTPAGAESQAYLPKNCRVITEGLKDALAGCWHGGIPTGALAGVSHYAKALKDEEGAGYVVLFDSDGWTNPSVFTQLFKAGKFLNGKIQLVPKVDGEPKAGLCEWFKAIEGKDKKAAYESLLKEALPPSDFLLELPNHWDGLGTHQLKKCIEGVIRLSVHLSPIDQDLLVEVVASRARGLIRKATILKMLNMELSMSAQQKKSQSGLIPLEMNPVTGKLMLPAPSAVANILVEHYRDKVAWNVQTQEFYRYASVCEGLWSVEPIEYITQAVTSELDASGASDIYRAGYIRDVLELLKAKLAVRRWDDADGLLPMKNGVLDLKTMKLSTHAPGYKLRWQLPYSYDPSATCPNIQDWLLETQDNDPMRVEVLRAYLKAVVCGRSDLQRFLEIVGSGGSGKSTYTRLAIALVGLENTCTTELKHLENSRFETANIYGKRLIVVTDSERYGGSVSVLKALTGQDPVRFEQKHKQAGTGFVSQAMVILAANETIQSNDYTSGLERRRLTVPFLKQVPPHLRRDLLTINHAGVSGEFISELPGLLNWVLGMPDERVKNLVANTALSVPSLDKWRLEALVESNPMAEWADEHLVLVPGVRTYIGVADRITTSQGSAETGYTQETYYRNSDKWLYPSYVQYCSRTGSRPVSMRRFSGLLEDLFCVQLKLNIHKYRDKDGNYFEGVTIRGAGCEHLPRLVMGLMKDDVGSVKAENLESAGCEGYVGSSNLLHNEEQGSSIYETPPSHVYKRSELPSTSSTSCTTNGFEDREPTSTLHQDAGNPAPSITVGSKVRRTDANGWVGEVLEIRGERARVLFVPDKKLSDYEDVLLVHLELCE